MAPPELQIKGIRASLKILRKDIAQIYNVGTANMDSAFKAMYLTADTLKASYMSKFEEGQVLAITSENDALFPTDEDIKERSEINALYYKIVEMQQEKQAQLNENSQSPRNSNSCSFGHSTHRRLARMELPKFNGKIHEWPKFKQLFLSMVHTNVEVPVIEKFHYLSTSVQGEPLALIAPFSLDEPNYQKAWDALIERYDNKRLLASSYVDQILDFSPHNGSPTLQSLQAFIRAVAENIAAFRSIEIPDQADFLWLTLALKKLDPQTKHDFEVEIVTTEWPTFKQLVDFVQGRSRVMQLTTPKNIILSKPRAKANILATTSTPSPAVKSQICSCKQVHPLVGCPIFKTKTPTERIAFLRQNNVCFNCLRSGHRVAACLSPGRCRTCKNKHHTWIHLKNGSNSKPTINTDSSPARFNSSANEKRDSEPTSSALVGSVMGPAQVLLGTAIGLIQDSENNLQPVRCLVDCGSQFSLMTSKCAKRLGLAWRATTHTPLGAGGVPVPRVKGRLKCRIHSRINQDQYLDVEPLIVGHLTGDLPTTQLPPIHGSAAQPFADPLFWEPREIDMLLGGDCFMRIITGSPVTLDNKFRALPTFFGLVVMGGANLDSVSTLRCHCLLESPINEELLSKFWSIEEMEVSIDNSKNDPCEQHFLKTHDRDSTGRYIVALPFKEQPEDIPEAETLALSRLRGIETRFKRHHTLHSKYADFMKEYEQLGHMTRTISPSAYVIPHHPVFRHDDPQAKIRVVFDASASTAKGSLNSKLYVGPKLQREIADIILNFRRYKIAVTADLIKMYRQIFVIPEHRRFQHIFWRATTEEAIKKYELNTITYGTASAPFQANRVVKQLCIDEGAAFPLAAEVLNNYIYVDDVVAGADSFDEALVLVEQLIGLLSKGQFPIHKWNSNCSELINKLNPNLTRRSFELSPETDSCVTKILGMSWDPINDCFSYSVKSISRTITKRSILSTVSRLYDPMGFLAPVIFKAKSFLQELWKLKVAWDDSIEDRLQHDWLDFATHLTCLQFIQIPRFILCDLMETKQLIGFCDASKRGFAAAIYLRIAAEDGEVKVTLLKSKTKLAPIKTISTPRLELCGAQLLVKLMLSIKNFSETLAITERIFFSDSTIVLAWLRISPQLLPTFVANRVSYITSHTLENEWLHVQSEDNPADVASRGIAPQLLKDETLWWAGPHWLRTHPIMFPQQPDIYKHQAPEIKPGTILTVHTDPPDTCDATHLPRIITWMKRHSSYNKVVRSLAYVLRFVYNSKRHITKLSGPLKLKELDNSLKVLIIASQRHEFSTEFRWEENLPSSKRLLILAAVLDDKGILRVGGRLQNSNLSEEAKSPILLPGKCHLVTLLIDHLHHVHFHLGQQALQALIRQKYWVFRLRQAVKGRIYKCMTCIRMKARPSQPIMGNLPSCRVRPSRPFTFTGVDYAGPFFIREKSPRRNSPTSKAYLVVFICMATKAVHLEVVTSMSTEAFLATLDRFIARRGLPAAIYSDCGPNFVGASRQLKDLFTYLKNEDSQRTIHNHAVNQGFEWHFNPPYSPHMGGLWEAAVKSAKNHLHRITKHNVFHLEELMTLFAKIEAILNSRPIAQLNDDDPNHGDFLTPGHFLIGAPLLSVPEADVTHLKLNRLSRWQLVSQMVQHFWARWHVEYLHTLQKKLKWYRPTRQLQIGELVLVPDPACSPLNWSLAKIEEIHSGEDNVVRVVTIKDRRGCHKRSIHKLIPLPYLNDP